MNVWRGRCPRPRDRGARPARRGAAEVLLTDDQPGQRAFYESLGYVETRDFGAGTLRAVVRFDG